MHAIVIFAESGPIQAALCVILGVIALALTLLAVGCVCFSIAMAHADHSSYNCGGGYDEGTPC